MNRTFFFNDLRHETEKATVKISCTSTTYGSDGQVTVQYRSDDLYNKWASLAGTTREKLKDMVWFKREATPEYGTCLEGVIGAIMYKIGWDKDKNIETIDYNNGYLMLIHVDLNDPDPNFEQYYFTTWNHFAWEQSPSTWGVGMRAFYYKDVEWLWVGPNWAKLPPFTQPGSIETICLLDYSNLSESKILALDYSYFQILSTDVNAAGDRTMVKFHVSNDMTGQNSVLDWNDLPPVIKGIAVLIEWSF
jgi:hypothetical protein